MPDEARKWLEDNGHQRMCRLYGDEERCICYVKHIRRLLAVYKNLHHSIETAWTVLIKRKPMIAGHIASATESVIEELEAENKRLLELLDTAYVLRFVDDTASRQQQMDFWNEVEKTIAV